jgi:hypothetical protein
MNNTDRITKLRAALRDVITLGSPLAVDLKRVLRETKVRKKAGYNERGVSIGPPLGIAALNAECRLLLYTVNDSERDLHWAAALEMLFELRLKPKIASRRQG